MAAWVDVAPEAEFPPGSVRTADADGTPIAGFNVDGRYHAIEDQCSHEAECLSAGSVEGSEVVCPRHGARFSLLTGEALTPPAYEPVACFPVRVEGGMVQVCDDRWD
jgi:3-phenylpropionate/trans-cinnamate dioxygenase ferredoxin subunit